MSISNKIIHMLSVKISLRVLCLIFLYACLNPSYSLGQTTNAANLALGKPTKQSSEYNVSIAGADKAVDGNTNGNFRRNAQNSVTHTGDETSAWWEVDLGDVYEIDRIVIWNRVDCCWERLQNFYVFGAKTPISEDNTLIIDGMLKGPFSPWTQGMHSFTLEIDENEQFKEARYIRILLRSQGRPRPLSLTEVEVFGRPLGEKAEEIPAFIVEDKFGRTLNDKYIQLVDWDGHLHNPYVELTIRPNDIQSFPLELTLEATGSNRLLMNLPSEDGPNGATKRLFFNSAADVQKVKLIIAPDRKGGFGEIETYKFALKVNGNEFQSIPIKVLDQDSDLKAKFPFTIDYSADEQNGNRLAYFKTNPELKEVLSTAVNDWFYFFKPKDFDEVGIGEEKVNIPGGPDWSQNRIDVENRKSYKGFYLFARTIEGEGIHSTGYPNVNGKFLSVNGETLDGNFPRSGVVCVEGNHTTTRFADISSDEWHLIHRGDNGIYDMYGLVMHEFGHSIVFNQSIKKMREYYENGGRLAQSVIDYQGEVVPIDDGYHIDGVLDRASGHTGGWGGDFPSRRWMLNKQTLLIAEVVGWELRDDLSIFMPPMITSEPRLASAIQGEMYSYSLAATGGMPLYHWEISNGRLPEGLTLDSFEGKIEGKVSPNNAPGQYQFTVLMKDQDFKEIKKDFVINVVPVGTSSETAALKLFWNPQRKDNVSTATARGENDAKNYGYAYVGTEGYVFKEQLPGTRPLQLYWSSDRLDNVTTATEGGERQAKNDGYNFIETLGYVYEKQVPGSKPLEIHWSTNRQDCMTIATEQSKENAISAGYQFITVIGYVLETP